VAFELGCLRALQDLGILDQVKVVSSVSGGSVLGAMYAYSRGSFSEFEQRAESFLRTGLSGAVLRELLGTPLGMRALGTLATAGVAAFGASVLRHVVRNRDRESFYPPLARWASRTNAFEQALRRHAVGDASLGDNRRNGVNLIINACDLRTGSAM